MKIPIFRLGNIVTLVIAHLILPAWLLSTATAQSSKGRNPLQMIQERHRERYREFSKEIAKLEEQCEQKELPEAAQLVNARLIAPDSLALRIDKLPGKVQPDIPIDLPDSEREWKIQLRKIEKDYARDLYMQARKALTQGQPGYAYDLVREAAFHDPDHPQVRGVLGFVRLEKDWVTPFAYSQIKKQNVWSDRFGWLPKNQEQKYNDGERYYKGRWISKDKEDELRRDFSAAWEIRTDHYYVKTNVGLEEGVKLAKALEEFYEVFQETFSGFFHTPEQLQKLFEGSAKTRPDTKPYTVHFYRSREEYCSRLKIFFPNIEQTNGVYMTSDRTAHFYDDPENDHVGTLYHEGTHQLFFESSSANRSICEDHHFWIIEGIACYMESFHRKNGSITLGDPKYIRFNGARHNLLKENYYVPLREFAGMGMQEFQSAEKLSKNYAQAAGLARFFMHYDNGRYREALAHHLEQLYSADAKKREHVDGLDVLTGVEYEDLDRQYLEDSRQTEAQPPNR